jgi:hypothetical protein
MLSERFVAAAIGTVLSVGVAQRADAFELQVAPNGAPVRWQADEVAFDMSGLDAAPQAQGAVLRAAQRALETWSSAGGPVLVESTSDGALGSIRWAAEPGDPGVSPDVLAETHLSYDLSSGAITRVDIVINGAGFRWATGDDGSCSAAFDLESTLAHEVGHALGLKHSTIADATMYTRPAPCAMERRDLATDDLDAIAALYPAELEDGDESAMGRCSAAGGNSSLVMLLLLVAAATLARSRLFMRR